MTIITIFFQQKSCNINNNKKECSRAIKKWDNFLFLYTTLGCIIKVSITLDESLVIICILYIFWMKVTTPVQHISATKITHVVQDWWTQSSASTAATLWRLWQRRLLPLPILTAVAGAYIWGENYTLSLKSQLSYQRCVK